VRAAGDLLSFNYRRTANAVRQHYGLPPLATTIREMTGRMSLNLVRGAPELDYNRRDLPPSVHYVGPLLWSPQGLETPAPWLEELPADQPLILVIGSTADKGKLTLLRAAAAGLAHRPLQVVITTGGSGSAGQLGLEPAAPNIRIAAWVPYSQVLPRTTAMVTVGGAGTVLTALNAGIPLLVVPAEADQPDNARRVVESGAGLRLSSSRCSPDRVREAVEALLAEPGYRQNATGLARVFQRYQGGTKAAELLEDMVENRGG
jgi:MGT family glycosyltransferase